MIVALLAAISGYNQNNINESINIIPMPSNYEFFEGSFVLSSKTGLHYESEFETAAKYLSDYIHNGSQISLSKKITSKKISFEKDEKIRLDEAYILKVSPKTISIKARSGQGAFYAVQSLRQLLPTAYKTDVASHAP